MVMALPLKVGNFIPFRMLTMHAVTFPSGEPEVTEAELTVPEFPMVKFVRMMTLPVLLFGLWL
jgi:hypothetical protein